MAYLYVLISNYENEYPNFKNEDIPVSGHVWDMATMHFENGEDVHEFNRMIDEIAELENLSFSKIA